MLLLSSADFLKNYLVHKILSGILSECQRAWNQISTDILSVLIWVQTIFKGHKQTTKVIANPIDLHCLLRLEALYFTQNVEIKYWHF